MRSILLVSFVGWAVLASAQSSKIAWSGCWGICIMDPVPGAEPAVLIDSLYYKVDAGVWYIDFSPDGTEVAFNAVNNMSHGNLWAAGIDGSNLRELVKQNTHICCMGNTREYTLDVLRIREVAWSPDGQSIAYLDRSGIKFTDPAGHPEGPDVNFEQGSSIWAGDGYLDWLADGRLLYVGWDDHPFWENASYVGTVNPDGTDYQALPGEDIWIWAVRPNISPDMTKAVFSVRAGSPRWRKCENCEPSEKYFYADRDSVFVVDMVTLEKKYVAEGVAPVWSPDSRQIAYLEYKINAGKYPSEHEGSPKIRIMNPDGSDNREIYDLVGYERLYELYWTTWRSDIPTNVNPVSWGNLKKEWTEIINGRRP